MTSPAETQQVAPPLRQELIDRGHLVATSVDGLYLRTLGFEQVVRGIEQLVHVTGRRAAEEAGEPIEPALYLPPMMPRTWFVETDYLRSFPDLTGSVHTFQGGDQEHAELLRLADADEDWTTQLAPSEVVLCSAACHLVYPTLTGTLPVGGRRLELQGTCFRHEPSLNPARMQSFRMHEFLRVGSAEETLTHRAEWLERALDLLAGLGLPVDKVVANDPFFGRAGRMLARSQRGAELKYEVVCPVVSADAPTAIASANYHLDHFGVPFDIRTADGEPAHSACFGFGLERIALALLATHGQDPTVWPPSVRERLWP